jgi:hypothetical protein
MPVTGYFSRLKTTFLKYFLPRASEIFSSKIDRKVDLFTK